MSDYYDPNGRALTADEWVELRRGDDSIWNEIARKTQVENADAEVSTVWLGIDHSFGDGPPLIWESMVFGGGLNQEQHRYSTMADAHRGHDELVERAEAEAVAFGVLVNDPEMRDAVGFVARWLAIHKDAWGIEDYDSSQLTRLFAAVTS